MGAVRQAASALIYGIVSLFLVIGSFALALAQGEAPTRLAATFTQLPSSTSTPTASPAATDADTATAAQPVKETATAPPNSPTYALPTITPAVATATYRPTCGAPYGWIRTYAVLPGDTLFRIATMHGVSVDALQRANCRSNTVIFVGERLWVPYVQPAATELTIIPTFPTPTEPATATESAVPSATELTPDP